MNQKRALSFLVALLLFCGFHQVLAADEVPDTILYNGKIVTVDDHSFTDNLGTIAQALAIKGDFILAIGNNTRIHGMAGPKTKLIDLKGREVLPGFAATHD